MIGDAYEDYFAAISNNINFVLRKHKFNKKLDGEINSSKIINFL